MSSPPPPQPSWLLYALTVILIGIIGFLDFVTGWEFSFSIFYLIPISLATWSAGRRAGLAFSMVGAVTWLGVDLASGHPYQYVMIPFWNSIVRMTFFLIMVLFLDSRRRALALEKEISRLDFLTGVASAKTFYEIAEREIIRAQRQPSPLSIAFFDCDNFKTVNDNFGHRVGDELLHTIGAVMKQNLRGLDLPARLGGDEFAVLMPETNAAQARTVIARLQVMLAEAMQRRNWPITFSVGVISSETTPKTAEDLVRQADALMYEIKKEGKNGIKYQTV
jgi:diguanylate cyclase (GGDEF)-like protein